MLLEKNGEYNEWWHTSLPAILFAYRFNVHSSTCYSSFELFYGKKSILSMVPVPLESEVCEPADLDGYVEACMA